jgi:hypothetical protein
MHEVATTLHSYREKLIRKKSRSLENKKQIHETGKGRAGRDGNQRSLVVVVPTASMHA